MKNNIKPFSQVSKREQQRRIKLWTDALESGKFKQTRRRLHNARSNGMCCLGVACHISAKTLGLVVDRCESSVLYNGEEEILPTKVMNYFGLRNADGGFGSKSLATLNDNGHYNFKYIAKLIKSRPEGLFSK
jgi:hypothetical protein